jgi:hypothetical protein
LLRIANRSDVQLLVADAERDSLFAFGWLSGPEVRATQLNESLGFVKDGKPYIDTNGLEWQGIKLEIS